MDVELIGFFMIIQNVIQNIDNLNKSNLSSAVAVNNQWLGRKVKYYLKYNKVIIDLINALSSKNNVLEIDLLRDLNHKITLISGQYVDNEINEKEFDELLVLAMRLHLNYIDVITSNPDEDPSSIQLSSEKTLYFLKSLAKLDKLIRNGETSPRREFVEKILAFCTKYNPVLDTLELEPFPPPNTSTGYFVCVDDKRILVFKPTDGDPHAFPLVIPRGEGFRRQIAAYLVDIASGGHLHIPLTATGLYEGRFGSIQLFLKNDGMVNALSGPKVKLIPTNNLQLISIHRSKLYELDGNLGNLLYRDKESLSDSDQIEVIPIDFDYTLPEMQEEYQTNSTFLKISWLYFPQLDEALTKEAIQHLDQTDIDYETYLLDKLQLSSDTQLLYNMSFWSWKIGADKKLTAGQILDFLDLKSYKDLYLSVRNKEQESGIAENESKDWIAKRKEIFFDELEQCMEIYRLNLNNETELHYSPALTCICEQDYGKAIRHMEDLLHKHNFRLVFGLMRKIIQSNLEAGERGMDKLKEYPNVSRDKMYAGFVTLVHTLEEMKELEKAGKLREWVLEEFD